MSVTLSYRAGSGRKDDPRRVVVVHEGIATPPTERAAVPYGLQDALEGKPKRKRGRPRK